MTRGKKNLLITVLAFAVVAIVSAINNQKVMEIAGKIPVVGDWVNKKA